jgi:hypothetical protein
LSMRNALRKSVETRVRVAEKAVCDLSCTSCASASRSRMCVRQSHIRVAATAG